MITLPTISAKAPKTEGTFKGRTAGGALLLAVLFGPCAQCQQPTTETAIVTDRPDVTESSIVIPNGSLQLENGITWTKDHADKVVDLSETLVRVGLLNRTEIRLVVPT